MPIWNFAADRAAPHTATDATTRGRSQPTLTRAELLRLAAGLAAWGLGPRLDAFAATRPHPSGTAQAVTLTLPTQGWIPTPMVTAALKAEPDVRFGGEGGQYPRHVAIDGDQGLFLLVAIDVGGILRSRDGGDTWEPANVGYSPRGAIHVAIDPRNATRAIAVGCNMNAKPWHGLYLTTDQASSWRHVQPATYSGVQDWREQLVYDRSSYDPDKGYCTDIYWSRLKRDSSAWGGPRQAPEQAAIYRSTDGGETWAIVNHDPAFGGGAIAAHPAAAGKLYVTTLDQGDADGIYGSDDGGRTFARLRDGRHRRSLMTSPAQPSSLWALTAENELIRSDDEGRTWQNLPIRRVNRRRRRLIRVAVSPVDARRIAVTAKAGPWSFALYVSEDGGERWTASHFDHRRAFLPAGSRHHTVAWSPAPQAPAQAYTQASSYIGRSTDGGASFEWASDGITMVAGLGTFHLSPNNPDHVFIPTRDQNGGVTFDGGRTWRYTNVSGVDWGGHNAGGVVVDADTILSAHRPGKPGRPMQLRIHQGGRVENAASWRIATMGPNDARKVRWTHRHDRAVPFGLSSCFVDPANIDVYFAGPYRSADAGRRWSPMAGCDGVLFASPTAPHTLYGLKYREDRVMRRHWRIVVSTDHGRQWTEIVATKEKITDVCANPDTGAVYFAANRRDIFAFNAQTQLIRQLATPHNQFGNKCYGSVAIDPTNTSRLYACGHADEYINAPSAIMSEDGGETWSALTALTPLTAGRRGGGSEARWVRVHARTGEAWFTTSCFGIWRYRPVNV